MERKHRPSIGELLYNENKDFIRLIAFVKAHQDTHNRCTRQVISKRAVHEFDMEWTGAAHMIAAYIEYLQAKIDAK